MNILGIDFGSKRVGIAISSGKIARPELVISYKDEKLLIEQIKRLTENEKVGRVVVGISEGEMEKKTREFIEKLKEQVKIPIKTFDETLSTYDAQNFAIESGMQRTRRKKMIDAMAAAVMLQNYLDMNRE